MQTQDVNVVKVTQSVPELLAPAGDWEALRAAVANGADAVYFGLSDFNARHRANNFKTEELPEVISYLHSHNVRGYVAMNTLIFSDELEGIAKLVAAIAKAGTDAVIVQDLGLVRLIRRIAPNLAIHGSTQMTLTEPIGINMVQSMGVSRVILARELSLQDIEKIGQQTTMPVEVFVHGALCVAYSGQCLTSEAMGGRSANRGQCAQACRLPYEMYVDGEKIELGDTSYLLSPQDLAAPDLIGKLAGLGVSSIKIEGRLKSGQYVAATTRTYREAIDASAKGKTFTPTNQQTIDLQQSFSRGFGHGFLDGVDHQALVEGRFPKHRGVRVGTVHGVGNGGITIRLERPDVQVTAGDGIVFDEGHPEQDEQGGRVMTAQPVDEKGGLIPTRGMAAGMDARSRQQGNGGDRRFGNHRPENNQRPDNNQRPGNQRPDNNQNGRPDLQRGRFDAGSQAPKPFNLLLVRMFGEQVNLRAISIGAIVWRTDDPKIRRRLEQSYSRDVIVHRVPLDATVTAAIGQKLVLEFAVAGGKSCRVESEAPVEAARKFPLTADMLREQLDRLGNTPYGLRNVRLQDEAGKEQSTIGVMVPRSVLGDMRHRALDLIMGDATIGSAQGVSEDPAKTLDALRQERQIEGASSSVSTDPFVLGLAANSQDARSKDEAFSKVAHGPWSQGDGQTVLVAGGTAQSASAVAGAMADGGFDSTSGDAAVARGSSTASIASAATASPGAISWTTKGINLSVLARSMDQLKSAIQWRTDAPVDRCKTIYCEFEDVRLYRKAVDLCRQADVKIGLASTRIIKPQEHGLLSQIATLKPDLILARSLAALAYFRHELPGTPMVADYSFNISNELTAAVIARYGAVRLTPSYDLNWPQMKQLLERFGATHFEVVVHQHMPMFHMEHCIFAHVLSDGKDFRDCGRPCEKHDVRLGEKGQQAHPLKADVGCRNTLYNATAQSAAPLLWQMMDMGVTDYRVEMLAETGDEVAGYLDRYASVLLRRDNGRQTWRQLRVLNQLGVTSGTLGYE